MRIEKTSLLESQAQKSESTETGIQVAYIHQLQIIDYNYGWVQ